MSDAKEIKKRWNAFLDNVIGASGIGNYSVCEIDYKLKEVWINNADEIGKALGVELKVERTQSFYRVSFKLGNWMFYDILTKEEKENKGL